MKNTNQKRIVISKAINIVFIILLIFVSATALSGCCNSSQIESETGISERFGILDGNEDWKTSVIVDKNTGVEYLCVYTPWRQGFQVVPMFDVEGNILVDEEYIN